MSTITQTAPFSDSIAETLDSQYENQLVMSGAAGLVTYTVETLSAGLLIDPTGYVTTIGILGAGNYTASGTAEDGSGNTGTWTFSLQVLDQIAPNSSVVPIVAAAPSQVEISVPFGVDPATGGIGILTSYPAMLQQHIETILLTLLGERVMMPTFGSTFPDAQFSPIGTAFDSTLLGDIRQAIQKWEPAVQVLDLQIKQSPQQPTLLVVSVDWAVAPSTDVNTSVVQVGGTVSQVSGS